jgi:hypothetical protein
MKRCSPLQSWLADLVRRGTSVAGVTAEPGTPQDGRAAGQHERQPGHAEELGQQPPQPVIGVGPVGVAAGAAGLPDVQRELLIKGPLITSSQTRSISWPFQAGGRPAEVLTTAAAFFTYP